MKIGILTFARAFNCGAVLQAYALQTVLMRIGHNVEFIDLAMEVPFSLRRLVGKGVVSTFYKWQALWGAWRFRNEFAAGLHFSPKSYRNGADLQIAPPQYDIYIAGSDQVWNTQHFFIPAYFLTFAPAGAKKVAYAASLGQHDFNPEYAEQIRAALDSFSAISIRERSSLDSIRKIYSGPLEVTLDPTLLLDARDYLPMFDSALQLPNQPYIGSYILFFGGDSLKWKLQALQKGNDACRVFNLNNPQWNVPQAGVINRLVTPGKLLKWIHGSHGMVCASFHAVVFSLLFHKAFIALTPDEQPPNRRILDLLMEFGLQERLVRPSDNINWREILARPINWGAVDEKLRCLRQDSLKFIHTHIGELS